MCGDSGSVEAVKDGWRGVDEAIVEAAGSSITSSRRLVVTVLYSLELGNAVVVLLL